MAAKRPPIKFAPDVTSAYIRDVPPAPAARPNATAGLNAPPEIPPTEIAPAVTVKPIAAPK